MNKEFQRIIEAADGRFFSDSEQVQLRRLTAGFINRMTAMTEVREAEESIVRAAVDEVVKKYADFDRKYPDGRSRAGRDMALVLRYATHAMLRQDKEYLDENLLTWLATILRGIGFSPDFIDSSYAALERATGANVGREANELMAPFLRHCRATLAAAGVEKAA